MGMGNRLPGPHTRAYGLLSLIAVCGEFPADLLSHIPGSTSYLESLVWTLKREGLLRTYYRDRLRGYRLGRRAKQLLLQAQPERFSFFLTGNTDTNLLKSEVTRRLRLHRIAELYVRMQNAGAAIFRDEKPRLFAPDTEEAWISRPVFYSSREVKELGLEAVKIRGSRMTGVLLTKAHVFLTYNSESSLAKWDYRAEQRAQALLNIVLCRRRFPTQYGQTQVQGILFGSDMEPLFQILSSADSGTRCFFLLDGNYEHFYYLTNDHYGEVLIRLLANPDQAAQLHNILSQGLCGNAAGFALEHDGISEDGEPVLFCHLPDIPRIHRFYAALQLQERTGTVICFDFQAECFRRCLGPNVTLQTIDFAKFERRFFP